MDATRPTTGTFASRAAPLGVERSERRDIVHVVLLTVPWAGLVWLWWELLRNDAGGLSLAASVVGVAAVSTFAVTTGWITHNLSIARRKGPRRGLPAAVLTYDHDWTGRPVHAVWSEVGLARVVVVVATDDHKTFLSDPDPAPDAGPPASASARAGQHEQGRGEHLGQDGQELASPAGASA